MTITLQTAETQLQTWIEADSAVASGQSYQMGNRRLQRADAAEITNKIKFWSDMVNQLTDSGIYSQGVGYSTFVANFDRR